MLHNREQTEFAISSFYAKWVWDKQNHYVSASTSHHVYYSSDIPGFDQITDSSVHIVFSSSNPWPLSPILSPDHLSDTLTTSSREWHQNSWLLYEAFIFQYSTRLKYTFPFKRFFPRHRLHEVKYPSSSNKLLSPVQEIKSSHRLCFIKLGFIKINLSF